MWRNHQTKSFKVLLYNCVRDIALPINGVTVGLTVSYESSGMLVDSFCQNTGSTASYRATTEPSSTRVQQTSLVDESRILGSSARESVQALARRRVGVPPDISALKSLQKKHTFSLCSLFMNNCATVGGWQLLVTGHMFKGPNVTVRPLLTDANRERSPPSTSGCCRKDQA